MLFTKELFGKIKELHDIQRNIVYSQGVFYNKAKVDMHFSHQSVELQISFLV